VNEQYWNESANYIYSPIRSNKHIGSGNMMCRLHANVNYSELEIGEESDFEAFSMFCGLFSFCEIRIVFSLKHHGSYLFLFHICRVQPWCILHECVVYINKKCFLFSKVLMVSPFFVILALTVRNLLQF
jgi:hypothetical protein